MAKRSVEVLHRSFRTSIVVSHLQWPAATGLGRLPTLAFLAVRLPLSLEFNKSSSTTYKKAVSSFIFLFLMGLHDVARVIIAVVVSSLSLYYSDNNDATNKNGHADY